MELFARSRLLSRAWSPFCSQVVLAIGPFEGAALPMADHEQSLEDESTERLHQELSGVTPDGTPGCHCLEFDSWWNEGKQRRFVYIRYSITEGAFQMAIDEDSNLYHVPVAYGARTGEALNSLNISMQQAKKIQ
eukprot:g23983.t1